MSFESIDSFHLRSKSGLNVKGVSITLLVGHPWSPERNVPCLRLPRGGGSAEHFWRATGVNFDVNEHTAHNLIRKHVRHKVNDLYHSFCFKMLFFLSFTFIFLPSFWFRMRHTSTSLQEAAESWMRGAFWSSSGTCVSVLYLPISLFLTQIPLWLA